MGKANRGGQKRKEAPARKQLQGRGGNSGLLHKNNHKQQHAAAGLDGGTAMGKKTLAQQLLQPNKRTSRGKRRRKSDGSPSKPRSSETAVIQAEYAAVDAREKAKDDAEEARRLRAPARIKLAPSTTALRMPSEGEVSMASLRASSSTRMVEALLQSITDDPAPDVPACRRPVRSAGRKRKGNPYAALGNDDSDSDQETAEDAGSGSNDRRRTETNVAGASNAFAGAWGGKQVGGGGLMAFASPSSFTGFSGGNSGSGGGSAGTGAWSSGAGGAGEVAATAAGGLTAVGGRGAAQALVTAVVGSSVDADDDPDL
ncbi:unnamed protein product [Pylaiella littoralis]